MSAGNKKLSQNLDFIPDSPTELRTAVTRMAAHINAVDWQFLKLIAAMDRTRGWREGGYCNLSNWLDHRCGMGTCAARERIRISRALVKLSHIDAAFRDGVISYSKVRAITRVATPETDEMLLAIAKQSSAAQLDGLVRTYERVGGKKRQPAEQQRSVSWHYEDGMLIVTAAVPAAQGALLIKALEKVVSAKKDETEAYFESLNRGECQQKIDNGEDELIRSDVEGPEDVSAEIPENERTLNAVSERVKAPGPLKAPSPLKAPNPLRALDLAFHHASREQRFADALIGVAEHYLAGSGQCEQRRAGQRYEVMLHIDRNQLAEQHQDSKTRFYVDPDWGIDEDEARQIACDADITEFIQNEKGDFLNYERRSRIVPTRLLRALKIRHQNRCSFPGCPHHRYLEAHHVRHWIDGGETSIDNMALLCSTHHRLLHHRAFHMTAQDGDIIFASRDGEVIETTLATQFPNVSAEAPGLSADQSGHRAAEHVVARTPRKSPVFEHQTDRDIIDMLDFRERWGDKRRDRILAQMLK